MDPSIAKLKSTTFCGRRFTRKQLFDIQRTVHNFPALSRNELAQTICEHLQWHTPSGGYRVNACLTVLKNLQQLGVVRLPDLITYQQRGAQKQIVWTQRSAPQADIDCDLAQLMPIELRVVTETEAVREWNELVDRHHYLDYRRPIGQHLRYFIVDCQGRRLGCMMFMYATLSLHCRDEWVGWQDKKHKKHLDLVVNNNRFLILPWVRVKNLASKALSMACRQLSDDWQRQYSYKPVLIETFVDPERFDGSCYRAANWFCIGQTKGRAVANSNAAKGRKDVYLYPLVDDARTILLHGARPEPRKATRRNQLKPLDATDPFVHLWQSIIGIVIEVAEDFDRQWQQRRRVLNSLLIMLFIFRLVFASNQQGYAITLTQLWDQCRVMNIPLPQQHPVAPSAMCKARTKLDESIFQTLQAQILRCTIQHDKDAKWKGHQIYAVDGSKMNLPRELIEAGYRCPSPNAYYPQGLVSCLYQLKTQIPTDFDMAAHGNERRMARAHLKALNAQDVVVYDRGYYSFEMLHEHVVRGVHPVFRVKRKAAKEIERFIASDQTDATVEMRPNAKQCKRIRSRSANAQCAPITVRLVKYVEAENPYTLATALFDRKKYTLPELSDLYHARWGIEELYKVSKNLLSIEDFHGRSERGVKQELYAHFVMITLTRLFSNYSDKQSNPNGCDDKKAYQSNFKNSLAVVGKKLEVLLLKSASMVTETLNQIIASIGSCGQRKRPDRSYDRNSNKPIGKWKPCKPAKKKSN